MMALAVHRLDVRHTVRAHRTVAEQELHRVVGGHSHALQLLGVGGELEQGRHTRAAGELRVLHAVAAVRQPDDEVGEAEEGPVEERGLEDDLRSRREGRRRLLDRGGEGLGLQMVGSLDLGDTDPELLAIPFEDVVLVLVAETRRTHVHRVEDLIGLLQPAQLDVQSAQEGELALRGLREVAGARDDHAVEQEHGDDPSGRWCVAVCRAQWSVSPATDTQPFFAAAFFARLNSRTRVSEDGSTMSATER